MKQLLFLCFSLFILQAQVAIDILNEYRKSSGLAPLRENDILAKASLNHAYYLQANPNDVSHTEHNRASMYFTGREVSTRAIKAGYYSKLVSENFAVTTDERSAIEGLFTAIYHRFSLLSFSMNEVGYDGISNYHVYVLGNSYINELCQKKQYAIDNSAYVKGLCASKSLKIDRYHYYNALKKVITATQTQFVLFPFSGADEIVPSFYQETPDPLPNLEMSGNPISIHFNPLLQEKIRILSFELRDESDELVKVKRMHAANDPHKRFSKKQFAFFPLRRLDWESTYWVSLRLKIGEKEKSLDWSFQTKRLENTFVEVHKELNYIELEANKAYDFYFSSEKLNAMMKKPLTFESTKDFKVQTQAIDTNTYTLEFSEVETGSEISCFYTLKGKTRKLLIRIVD